MRRTFVIIKPDAVASGLVGEILNKYEKAGLQIDAMERRVIAPEFADQHYLEHVGRDYYPTLRQFMTSGPLIALVLSGVNAVERVRELNGATDPAKAEPGTIRAEYAQTMQRNAVHASDSEASAATEIELWFPGG